MESKLIIKRCDDLGHVYVFEIMGYCPTFLEVEFERMAGRLVSGDCSNLEGELKDFCKFQRRNNGIRINFQIFESPYSLDVNNIHMNEKGHTTRIIIRVRRSIIRILKEHL